MKVFALTIFLGAWLLFQMQPLMAKFILPWFGGGPGVWTTCMLFFQVVLVAGYAYAHAATQYWSHRTQAAVHVGLLLLAMLFLPVVPGANWKPAPDAPPAQSILLLLLVCLGLPFFVLASTGPLMQAWFSRLTPGAVPYRLYALSNAGSLLALVSFPFVFEPNLTRTAQSRLWAWSFGIYVLCGAVCAWRLWRLKPETERSAKLPQKFTAKSRPETPPIRAPRGWWFGLATCGSVMLLAITNKLCLDVASVPFLWVLPLSLYLLSFIICFDRPAWYSRKWFLPLLLPALALVGYVMALRDQATFWLQAISYTSTLFVGCMICHGEVYRLKPSPRFLTSFYLCIAAGGAAGGLLVGIAAPLVFRSYAELNWGIWLLACLICGLHFREQTSIRLRWLSLKIWPLLLLITAALGGLLLIESHRTARGTTLTTRNFYGVLRVTEEGNDTPLHLRKLINGFITHGLQFTDPQRARLPTTYYHELSGVGVAINNFPRQSHRRIGVVGLGTGTLAAYGRSGDDFCFYEIDPNVRWVAEHKFTYLKDSRAKVEIIPGDARLSLEREPSQQFDFLVLDAFGSDAIPVHLLTLEAFDTYFRHLKSDGVIAVHISNLHINLLPVVVGAARSLHTLMICIKSNDILGQAWRYPSSWVILSRNRSFIMSDPVVSRGSIIPTEYEKHPVVWTDDYVSLFPILRH